MKEQDAYRGVHSVEERDRWGGLVGHKYLQARSDWVVTGLEAREILEGLRIWSVQYRLRR
jgi:hypothetical protein